MLFVIQLGMACAEDKYKKAGGFCKHCDFVVFPFGGSDVCCGGKTAFGKYRHGLFHTGKKLLAGHISVDPVLKQQGKKDHSRSSQRDDGAKVEGKTVYQNTQHAERKNDPAKYVGTAAALFSDSLSQRPGHDSHCCGGVLRFKTEFHDAAPP